MVDSCKLAQTGTKPTLRSSRQHTRAPLSGARPTNHYARPTLRNRKRGHQLLNARLGGDPGFSISPFCLFERVDVQSPVSDQTLQPDILHRRSFNHFSSSVLMPLLLRRSLMHRVSQMQILMRINKRHAFTQQPVSLPQFANNLLRRLMPAVHLVLLAHTGNRGLTSNGSLSQARSSPITL